MRPIIKTDNNLYIYRHSDNTKHSIYLLWYITYLMLLSHNTNWLQFSFYPFLRHLLGVKILRVWPESACNDALKTIPIMMNCNRRNVNLPNTRQATAQRIAMNQFIDHFQCQNTATITLFFMSLSFQHIKQNEKDVITIKCVF